MVAPPTLHQPRRRLPRYVLVFPTTKGNTSPFDGSHLHSFALFLRPLAFRSSQTSRTSPSPGIPPQTTLQTGTFNLYVRQRRTCPNPRITPTRNVMLSCTTSLSERRSKNCIGRSRTMKSLPHCPLSELFPNFLRAPEFHSTSYLISTQCVTLVLGVQPCRCSRVCID
jgi:hypothetical protein